MNTQEPTSEPTRTPTHQVYSEEPTWAQPNTEPTLKGKLFFGFNPAHNSHF